MIKLLYFCVRIFNFANKMNTLNLRAEIQNKGRFLCVNDDFYIFDVAGNRLSGNAGCNRIMGQIEYSEMYKNIIKFPQVATTRMGCPDMSGEKELLTALDKVVRFEAVGENKPVDEIALYGTDNSKLLVIKKQK